MGASPAIVATGVQLHADRAWRLRRRSDAFSEQRHLSRSRRRRHRHASAMGLEHPQPDSGSLPDLRPGPISETRSYGRGAGHVHRARHRRSLPVLPSGQRHGTPLHSRLPCAAAGLGAVAAGAGLHYRNFAVPDRPGELDRPGAHRQPVRRAGAGRLHDRDSHRHLRDLALVGIEQCRRHARRPEPWRGPIPTARAARYGGPAYGT